MNEKNLSITGLSAGYGTRRVLEGVSLTVEEGVLLSILGRNGSGKSTLFRCILGLLLPIDGEIRVRGISIRDLNVRERARTFAYIPQTHPSLLPLTAFEAVLMGTTPGLGFFSTPGRRERVRAERAMEEIGIAHLAERFCHHLSGGELQLVLIARALAQDARILVMDEPCSNLDYGNQIRIWRCARRLAHQGYLVLVSTHNPDQSFAFADLAMVLLDGRAERMGPPEAILDRDFLEKVYDVPLELHHLASGIVCAPRRERPEGTHSRKERKS